MCLISRMVLERVQEYLTASNYNYRLTLHHFASKGDAVGES